MTVEEFLKDRYETLGYVSATAFMMDTRPDLTLQTICQIILGKPKGLLASLIFAVAIGCSKEELAWICKERGDKTLWRLFENDILTSDENAVLNDYRQLKMPQKKAVKTMLKGMIP